MNRFRPLLAVILLVATGCQERTASPPGPPSWLADAGPKRSAEEERKPENPEEPPASVSLPGDLTTTEDFPSAIQALEQRARELAPKEPEAALALFARASEENRRASDLFRLSDNFLWCGSLHLQLGQLEEAEKNFDEALAVAVEDGDLTHQAEALNFLGVVKRETKELGRAGELYLEAAEVLRSLASPETKLHLQIFRNLAGLAQLENDPQRARLFLADAVRVAEKLNDERSRAVIGMDRGWFEELDGNPQQAFVHYAPVLEKWHALEPFDQVVFWTRMALNFSERNQGSRAIEANLRALEIASSRRDIRLDIGVSTNLCRLSVLYPKLERAGDGASYCDVASENAKNVEEITSLSGLYYWQARRAEQLRHLQEAIDLAEKAVRLSESLRWQVPGRNNRARFVVGRAKMFGYLADLLMAAHRQSPADGFDLRAMKISERLKARTLLDLWWEAGKDRPAAAPAELREEIGSRRVELASLQRLPASEKTDSRISMLLAELDVLDQRLRRSGLEESRMPGPGDLDLESIQAALDPQTAIVLLLYGETNSYLFTVRKEGKVRSYELAKPADLDQAANAFLKLIGDSEPILSPAAVPAGEKLAALLWGEQEERLRDLPERLVFVGDGDLQQFPLLALPRIASRSDETEYLIDSHEVVHLPSLALLDPRWRKSLEELGKPTRGAMIFADPLYSLAHGGQKGLAPLTTDEIGALFGPDRLDLQLGRLRYAEEEAQSIRARIAHRSIEIFTGPDASRERVLAEDIASSSILHFVSHGGVDPDHDELSALLLSEVDRDGNPVDGALRLQDLYGLPPLRTELVVASACQTGVGDNLHLEGVGGLAQGFLQAGARRVIYSLWQVDSQTTAIFMDRFYFHLDRGAAPGAALRQAALDLRREAKLQRKPWGSPFYWAPFILAGDWHSFELPPKLSSS